MVVGVDCVPLVGGEFLGRRDGFCWPMWLFLRTNLLIWSRKGTFGPMASAFSVCALVENWRVMIPPGGTESNGVEEKDPKWCVKIFHIPAILPSPSLTPVVCVGRLLSTLFHLRLP